MYYWLVLFTSDTTRYISVYIQYTVKRYYITNCNPQFYTPAHSLNIPYI